MSEEQKKTFKAIADRRGQVPAPMQLLLRSPELADKAQALGQFLRFRSAHGKGLLHAAI